MRPCRKTEGRARLTEPVGSKPAGSKPTGSKPVAVRGFSRSFSRRQSRRLSAYREGLLAHKLPLLALDPALPFGGDKAFFERYREDLRLEIGFGAGEHLSTQVARAPQTGFIGCEPYRNGVAALLADLELADLEKGAGNAQGKAQAKTQTSEASNLRLFADDALLLLPALPDGCLSFLYLLFPDPWPRRRHGKRRLLRASVLDSFARLLRAGGELRWASDEPAFIASGLAACCAHPHFAWRATRPEDWRTPPASWVATRYQRKAECVGRPIFYGSFERR